MERDKVDRWLNDYVEAWKTYDRDQIVGLFAEDVSYRYHPYDDPVTGREAVVESWLGSGATVGSSTRDEEGTYDASYQAIAVDGDVAIATGSSSYRETPSGPVVKVFDNCFVMRFDSGGRCREFIEWFIQRPKP